MLSARSNSPGSPSAAAGASARIVRRAAASRTSRVARASRRPLPPPPPKVVRIRASIGPPKFGRATPARAGINVPARLAQLPNQRTTLIHHHSCASALVTSAQAGTPRPQAPYPIPLPFPNSSLPPNKGGGQVGGAAQRANAGDRSRPAHPHRAPTATARIPTPVIPALSLRHTRALRSSFLRRQEWRGRGLGHRRAAGRRSLPPTPHLASPLKGGKDEFFLGEGVWRCWLGGWGSWFLPAQE